MTSLNRDIANSIGIAVSNDTITDTGEVSGGGGAESYATTGDLPTAGNEVGDQAFVTGNDRLYIWSGAGWYNIALINNTPTINRILDSDNDSNWTSFALNTDGSASTITIVATDPEGFDVTYTTTTDSGFDGLATVSGDSSVFTITPLSEDSATETTGTITFKASDGVNIASTIRTFTLQFRTDWSSFTKELIDADDLSNFGQNGTSDYLGSSVELGRTTGNIALVGEYGYDQGYASYGTNYLLTYDGAAWSSQRINHGLSNHEYKFGSAANGNFMSKDEQHFWIFGLDNGSNPSSNCGNIQYWYLNSGTWTKGVRYNGSANNMMLGSNLWMNDDGTHMVASEHGYNSFEGRVRQWTRSGTTWTEQSNIRVSGASTYDYFAYQLAVSPNFDYATVTYGPNGHSTRQFKNYSISGTTWTLDNTQTMSQAGVPTNRYIQTDSYGASFRTDENYTTLICLLLDTSSPYHRRIGVFHRDATNNTWDFATELTRQQTDQHYYRAAISPDGLEILQIPATWRHATTGTIERYSRDSVTSTSWTYTAMTVDFEPSEISMTADKILVGSRDYSKANNSMTGSGGIQFLYA